MKSLSILGTYAVFLKRELLQPVNYLIAIGIGLLILLLQGNSPLSSPVPYLVPVFVQAFSKSYVKFTSRHKDLLLSLPERRNDPAFLMSPEGDIILAAGNTQANFQELGIKSIEDLLDEDGSSRVLGCVEEEEEECGPVECYSPPFDRWYSIKTGRCSDGNIVLVWFENISRQIELNQKLSKIRDFSDSLINELSELVEEDTVFARLAELILDLGYEGVFIAEEAGEELEGRVYRADPGANTAEGKTVSSEKLRVSIKSSAPIWLSRREGRMYYDQAGSGGSSGKEFLQNYPFDKRVVDFLGSSVMNFVNYHGGTISIIAFNLNRSIGSGDLLAMEVLVNSARSVSSLLSLASENDQKFLQSVTGLCAAAEYSDEITGMHILRVNEYSRLLAEKAGIAAKGQTHIGQVAAMHDIGKVAIPHLIKLERAFTSDERREMEMHTIYGAQIITKMMTCCAATEPRLAMAFEIALNHHQMYNGGGYPPIIDKEGKRCSLESKYRSEYDNLRPARGSEIPLTARIVSLSDTYDALRSARQYKKGKSHQETVEIIRIDDRSGLSGDERFGPDLMGLFERHHEKFNKIYNEMQG